MATTLYDPLLVRIKRTVENYRSLPLMVEVPCLQLTEEANHFSSVSLELSR